MTTQKQPPGGSPSRTDESAVRQIVARANDAQNDPGALLDLHTPETVIVNIAGRRVLGRDAFARAMSAALASTLSDVRTSVQIVDVRFPATALAIVSCIKTVHDERADDDRTELPGIGALSYTMIRTTDGWRIAHAQTTPLVR